MAPGSGVEIVGVDDPTPRPDEYRANLPVIPGHEFAGTVVAAGDQARDVRVGNRISADPEIPCLRCRFCHQGRVNLCDNFTALGVTMNGASAQYPAVPEHLCVVLPDSLDLHHAARADSR